jgi:large subunit ribosomal protein L24
MATREAEARRDGPAKLRIRKGDRVQVRSGKDRGKQGVVMRVLPKEGKVIVDGVNVAKRHTRPRRATMQGGIIDKDMPISVSAVSIVCPQDGPTRIGIRLDEQGRKVRVCRKCGGDL